MSRILPLLLVLFIATGLSCKPTHLAPSSLTGKLVVDGPCGNYVIQVLQGKTEPGRIVGSWKDTLGNAVYTNVFTVQNICTFPEAGLKKGDVFTFEWDIVYAEPDCAVCQIYVPTPPVRNVLKNIQKVK